ncbi:MAG: hypothetical protein R3E57_05435 [Porticoccaceae bacterium]
MIDKSVLETLVLAGHSGPSADNSQPLRFVWDGRNTLSVFYDEPRVRGRTFPADNPATLIATGAAVHNILETANRLGVETEITWHPEDKDKSKHYADIRILSAETSSQIASTTPPALEPLLQRHTNRHPYIKSQLPNHLLTALGSMREGQARLVRITNEPRLKRIGELVKKASEIRFQTQEVHEWLGASLRFPDTSVKKSDGLDINTLALPPGGSALLKLISSWKRMSLLNRIGFYKLLAAIDAQPVKQAPALIAVIAPNSIQDTLSAGQLLERCWVFLNNEKVAVHPYYVISDQLTRLEENGVPDKLIPLAKTIKGLSEKEFGYATDERLCMLLRIGYPRVDSPVRSQRLPLEDVYTDLSST